MTPTVLVDVDGTVTVRTFGAPDRRGPYDWSRVGEDEPNLPVIALVRILREAGHRIVFCSGRDAVCIGETWRWLVDHGVALPGDDLFMRAEKDNRPDHEVKAEIYDREIVGNYDVRYVLDDRSAVVRMWRERGLTVLQVAAGDF